MVDSPKRSRRRGFTLLEALVGVAVIAILLAISIPSVITASRQLNMTKLDEAAREVFTAAQNRLTAMKASGELEEFRSALNAPAYEASRLAVFDAQPGDYPCEDFAWQNFFYLTADDDIFKTYVLSDTAFQAIEGKYVVELNPESGDVYSVFYGEYDTAAALEATYCDISYYQRDAESRAAVQIGYYSGLDLSAAVAADSFRPQVTVHNEEELYLEITCPGMLQFAATSQHLSLTLTLADKHGEVWAKTYTGTELVITGGELRVYVLLDSMRTGSAFHELFPALHPGDDITATVVMQYDYRGREVRNDPAYEQNIKTVNSLFDSVIPGEGAQPGTIYISRLRHLNNLRSDIYAPAETIGSVVQTQAIYFDMADWRSEAWCPMSGEQTQHPLGTFAPLVNEALFGSSAIVGPASFVGSELYDMAIGSGKDRTGLFSYASCAISNVRLIDPILEGGNYTGALVGRLYGGSVVDCGVYLSTASRSGAPYDEAAMEQRLAQRRVRALNKQNVGGLVGAAQGSAHIENSFAAINVLGSTNTGALIGSAAGAVSIKNCYASGDVTAGSNAGGFIGRMEGGALENCYTTADVVADSLAGGFAGVVTGGSVKSCIAYGTTKKADGTVDRSTSGGFAGSAAGGSYTTNLYLRQNGYNSDYDKQTLPAGIASQPYALFAADPPNAPASSHPYSIELRDTAYPFPLLLGSHYGDWPLEATIETSLIYYEKYVKGSDVRYGYYADGYARTGEGDDAESVSAWNLNTLMSQSDLDEQGYRLVEDGYAVLSIYNLVRIQYKLNNLSPVMLNVNANPGNNQFVPMEHPSSLPLSTIDKDTGDVIGEFYAKYLYIFQLPFELQETNRDTTFTFYDQLKMTGYAKGNLDTTVFKDYTFYYCPHFARNAINPDVRQNDPGRPKYPERPEIYVRSARHLNALGRYSYYWSKGNAPYAFKFVQEMDINFKLYTIKYCGRDFNLMQTDATNNYRNRPIGRPMGQSFTDPWGQVYRPGNFQNTYDGGDYEIIDYSLVCYKADNAQFTGMFGEIMGATITNVHMVASNPERKSGYVTSQYGGTQGSPGTGALVGLSYAESGSAICTITNCSVSGYWVEYIPDNALNPSHAAVGGLIGYNMGNVTNCSAVSYLVRMSGNANNKIVSVSGLIGGMVNGTVSQCYAGGTLVLQANLGKLGQGSCINGLTGYSPVYSPGTNNFRFGILNCYSFCTIGPAPSGAAANYTVYGAGGTKRISNDSYTNCYYLKDTLTVTPANTTGACDYKQLANANDATLSNVNFSGISIAKADRSYPWSDKLKGQAYPFPAFVELGSRFVHYGDWPPRAPQPEYIAYYEKYSDGSYGLFFYDVNKETSTVFNVASNTTVNDRTIKEAGYGILRVSSDIYTYGAIYKKADGTPFALETGTEKLAENVFKDEFNVRYSLYALTEESVEALTPDPQGALEVEVRLEYWFAAEGEILIEPPEEARIKAKPVYINPAFGRALGKIAGKMGLADDVPLEIRTPEHLDAINRYTLGKRFALTRQKLNLDDYTPERENVSAYVEYLGTGCVFEGNNNTIEEARLPIFAHIQASIPGDTLVRNLKITDASATVILENLGTVSNVTLTNCSLERADDFHALLARKNSGVLSGCTIKSSKLTLTGSASGALAVAQNSGTVENTKVETSAVEADADAAGFVYENIGTITNCAAIHTDVTSEDARAAGFVVINGWSISGSYVGPAEKGTSYSGKTYGDVEISGNYAFGFAAASTGSLRNCFAVAALDAQADAAGFAGTLSNAEKCFANCEITAGNSGTAAGFTLSGSGISYCYACGEIKAAQTSYGFLQQGDAMTSYTICKLPSQGTRYGFSPSAGSSCYWVRDAAPRSFNETLTADANAKTFRQLSQLFQSSTAYPFTSTNGTTYPYAVADVTHHGDWPFNPPPAMKGIIGVVQVQKSGRNSYYYKYCYYDSATETTSWQTGNQNSSSLPGPSITWSRDYNTTRYYVYYSSDLTPGVNVVGGWTYIPSNVNIATSRGNTGGYYFYEVTLTGGQQAHIDFKLNGEPKFTVYFKNDSISFNN